MPTLTIELTDEQAQTLAQEAERLHLTAQELAVQRLLATGSTFDFEALARELIEEDKELLLRLA